MTLRYALLAPLLTAGLAAAACTNTAAGAREDAKAAADKATAATAEASKATKDAAANATQATKDAAANATGIIAAAAQTIDVKSALIADRTVDASSINVDTFHETKTVVLKGSVPTAAQKEEAGRIAAAEAPGYRIDNQLLIVAKP
jgi:osmotically-inducible protein OsmY